MIRTRIGYILRCVWTEITTDGRRCSWPGCGRPGEYRPAQCWRHRGWWAD